MTEQEKQAIGKALGRVPSGVFILTAKHNDQATAMMASWVQQASFDPPTISVAIAKQRPIAELIRASKRLALSIVPNADKTLMKRYAKAKPGDDPFAGANTKLAPSGVPILADALAFLDCELIQIVDFDGDHDLYIAKITAAESLRDGEAFNHQRGNAFHY
ncbi:MAG TPA: flavin reductase family protein [Tepidisphaeraceae bacterium]|nr:flavin reductase family protein [Tepidisphaeraceae bacterium]